MCACISTSAAARWATAVRSDSCSTTSVFKFRAAEGVDPEELELEMIDLGVDEFYPEEDGITVYAPYESFGVIQKWLDDKGFEIVSGEVGADSGRREGSSTPRAANRSRSWSRSSKRTTTW